MAGAFFAGAFSAGAAFFAADFRPITRLAAAAAEPARDLRVVPAMSEGLRSSGCGSNHTVAGRVSAATGQANLGSPKCENGHPDG